MAFQRVFADDEDDLIAPTVVVAGFEIKDSGDEAPDVLHAYSLGVQIDEDSGLVHQDGVMQIAAEVRGVVLDGAVAVGRGGRPRQRRLARGLP